MAHWFEDYKAKVRKLNEYTSAIEARERVLIETLSDLAQGFGRKVEGQAWDHAMRRLAAEKLAEVAKMKRPERIWP